jgi:hypothetical protein
MIVIHDRDHDDQNIYVCVAHHCASGRGSKNALRVMMMLAHATARQARGRGRGRAPASVMVCVCKIRHAVCGRVCVLRKSVWFDHLICFLGPLLVFFTRAVCVCVVGCKEAHAKALMLTD